MAADLLAVAQSQEKNAARHSSHPELRVSAKELQPFDPAELTRRLELYQLERKAAKDLRRKSTGQTLTSSAHPPPRVNSDLFKPDLLSRSIEHHQKHDLKRRSVGDVAATRPRRSKAHEPFEAEQLKQRLEAHQRTLDQQAGISSDSGNPFPMAGEAANDSGVSLNRDTKRSRSRSTGQHSLETITSRRSNRQSVGYQPQSARSSFMRTTTQLPPDYLNVHIPNSTMNDMVLSSNRDSWTERRRSQTMDEAGKSKKSNRLSALLPVDFPLTNLSSSQRNLRAKAPSSDNRHSAIFNESVADQENTEVPSPTTREPNDRPNWSQQDEAEPANRESRISLLRSHLSFPWRKQPTAYAHDREAATAAEDEAARTQHKDDEAAKKPASNKSSSTARTETEINDVIPETDVDSYDSAQPREAEAAQKSLVDGQARKGYQEKVKEKRKAAARSTKPFASDAARQGLQSRGSIMSMRSMRSLRSVRSSRSVRSAATEETTNTNLVRRASRESMTPESLKMLQDQERKLKEMAYRQNFAAEKHARQRSRQEEKERVEKLKADRMSMFGDKLDGMTPESIRFLREQEKLMVWKKQGNEGVPPPDAQEPQSTADEKAQVGEDQKEAGRALKASKRGGLLSCFKSS